MTRAEGDALVTEKEGNLCARLYQRQDGTFLTADCPVGRRVERRGLVAGLAAGFVASVAFAGSLIGISHRSIHRAATRAMESLRNTQPFKIVIDRFSPSAPVYMTAGEVSASPRPPRHR